MITSKTPKHLVIPVQEMRGETYSYGIVLKPFST